GKDLLGFRVDYSPRRVLYECAATCRLPRRIGGRRLFKQGVVKYVVRVRVFRELGVLTAFTQSLNIAAAWCDRDIIVRRSVEQPNRLFAHRLVFDITGVTGRVERDVSRKI